MSALAQDIEVGTRGIRVDTGDAWFDFTMFMLVLVAVLAAAIVYRRWG